MKIENAKEIVNNMTNEEKFKIICRIYDIDKIRYAIEIWDIIKQSDYEDKTEYLIKYNYNNIEDRDALVIDKYMLDLFDFNEKQQQFIHIALENDIDFIKL